MRTSTATWVPRGGPPSSCPCGPPVELSAGGTPSPGSSPVRWSSRGSGFWLLTGSSFAGFAAGRLQRLEFLAQPVQGWVAQLHELRREERLQQLVGPVDAELGRVQDLGTGAERPHVDRIESDEV